MSPADRARWSGVVSRLLFAGLLTALLVSCGERAQRAPVDSPAAPLGALPTAHGQTFLWTVSSSTARVHLLGSIHVASRDIYPLDERIESRFERSPVLVLEMPVDAAGQAEAARKLARAGTYPAGESLDAHLDPALLQRLQQRMRERGGSLSRVRSFRPWFVATVLLLAEMQRLGYDPALGIDRHFADRADRKRVVSLESVDGQVAILSGLSERAQEAMLDETLTSLDHVGEELARAFQSWRAGDAAGIEALLVAPIRVRSPEAFQRLFVDRNRKMAAAVLGFLKTEGEYFVVVGCGHLVGAGGILDLLRERGYTPVQQ